MEVRLATASDVENLAHLHCMFRDSLQRSTPTLDEFRLALTRMVSLGSCRILVAVVDGRALGYATLQLVSTAWSLSSAAILEDLYVDEACRGQGVGWRLAKAAVEQVQDLGCTSISLDTNERNEASQKIYRSLGFTSDRARWGGGRQIRYDLKLAGVVSTRSNRTAHPTIL